MFATPYETGLFLYPLVAIDCIINNLFKANYNPVHEHVSDSDFIDLLQQNEAAAFYWLFNRYRDFIYSVSLRFCDDEVQAKDALQEVLIKLWQHRTSLNEVSNLTGYIQRLTRNYIIDLLRRKAHEAAIISRLADDSKAYHSDTEDLMLRKDIEHLLRQAVSQLPPQQRKVYQMSRDEGLKHEDIAAQLNISKDTVKKHMMAALKNIEQYIQSSNSSFGVLCACIAEIFS